MPARCEDAPPLWPSALPDSVPLRLHVHAGPQTLVFHVRVRESLLIWQVNGFVWLPVWGPGSGQMPLCTCPVPPLPAFFLSQGHSQTGVVLGLKAKLSLCKQESVLRLAALWRHAACTVALAHAFKVWNVMVFSVLAELSTPTTSSFGTSYHPKKKRGTISG